MSIMPFPDVAGGLAISPGCFGPPDPYTTPMPSLGAPTGSCGANQFASSSGEDCQGVMSNGADGIATASVVPMSLTSQYASGCTPPQNTGAQPVPPVSGMAPTPAPTGPYSVEVTTVNGANNGVASVPVYCVETGVTLVTGTCGMGAEVLFHFAVAGTYHFIGYGGTYEDCSGFVFDSYPGGTTSGVIPGTGPFVLDMGA